MFREIVGFLAGFAFSFYFGSESAARLSTIEAWNLLTKRYQNRQKLLSHDN